MSRPAEDGSCWHIDIGALFNVTDEMKLMLAARQIARDAGQDPEQIATPDEALRVCVAQLLAQPFLGAKYECSWVIEEPGEEEEAAAWAQ